MKKRFIALITAFVLVVQSVLPADIASFLPGLFTGVAAADYIGESANCVTSLDITVNGSEGTGTVDVDIRIDVQPDNKTITGTVIGKDSSGNDVTVERLRDEVKSLYEKRNPGKTFPNNADMLTPGDFGILQGLVDEVMGTHNWTGVPVVKTKIRISKHVNEYIGDNPASNSTVSDMKIPDSLSKGTINFTDSKNGGQTYPAGEYNIYDRGDYYEVEVALKQNVLFWEQDKFGFDIETQIENNGDDNIDWNWEKKGDDAEAEIVIDANRPARSSDYTLKKSAGESDSPFGVTFEASIQANGDNTLAGGTFTDTEIIKNSNWPNGDLAKLYSVTVTLQDGTSTTLTGADLKKYIDSDGNFNYPFDEESGTKADFTLNYAVLEESVFQTLKDNADGKGGVMGETWAKNKATFKPEDPDSETKEASADASLGNVQPVDKTGAPVPGDTQHIQWTITIDADNFEYTEPYFTDWFSKQLFEEGEQITVNGSSFTLSKTVSADPSSVTSEQAKGLLAGEKAVLLKSSDGKQGFLLDLTDVAPDGNNKIVITYTSLAELDEEGNAEAENNGKVVFEDISFTTPDKVKHTDTELDGISDKEVVKTSSNPIKKSAVGFDPKTGLFTWKFEFNEDAKDYDYAILKDTPDDSQVFPDSYRDPANTITLNVKDNFASSTEALPPVVLQYKGTNVPDGADVKADSQGYYLNEAGTELYIVLYKVSKQYMYEFQLNTKLVGGSVLGEDYDINEHYSPDGNGEIWYSTDSSYLKSNATNSVTAITPSGEVTKDANQDWSGARLLKSINSNSYGYVGSIDFGDRYDGKLRFELTVNPYCYTIDNAKLVEELPVGTTFGDIEKIVIYRDGYKNGSGETYTGADVENYITWLIEEGTGSFKGSKPTYSKDKMTFDFAAEPLDYCVDIYFYVTVDTDFAMDYIGQKSQDPVQFINTAVLTGSIDGDEFTDTQAASGKVQCDNVTKTGIMDNNSNAIRWEVDFNKDSRDMSGMSIIDDLENTGMRMAMRDGRDGEVKPDYNNPSGKCFIVEQVVSTDTEWGGTEKKYIDITDKFRKDMDLGGFTLYFDDNEYSKMHLRITFYTKVTQKAKTDKQGSFSNKIYLTVTGNENRDKHYDSTSVDGSALSYESWSGGSGLRTLTLYKTDENGDPLTGALFKISYYDPDAGVRKEETRSTNQTGSDPAGQFTYTDIPFDVLLTVQETQAPNEYVLDDTKYYVVYPKELSKEWFKEQYPNYDIVFAENDRAELRIQNKPEGTSASVSIYKTWDNFKYADLAPEKIDEFISKTVFTIEDEEGTTSDVTPTWDTTRGKLTFKGLKPNNTYTITEKETAEGYGLFNGVITVEVDGDANATVYVQETPDAEKVKAADDYTVANKYEYGSVTVNKTFEGVTLSELTAEQLKAYKETEFSLFYEPECTNLYKSATLTDDGKGGLHAVFDQLEQGTYYLAETNAPDGFTVSEDIYKCDVKGSGTEYAKYNAEGGEPVAAVTYENAAVKVTGSITADKTFNDTEKSEITPELLNGTKFALYKKYDNGVLSDKVAEKALSEDQTVTFEGLAPAAYYLAETSATSGYLRDKNVIKCVIDQDGNTTYYAEDGKSLDGASFENDKIKLEINKEYQDSKELGFELSELVSKTLFRLSRVEVDGTLTALAEAKPVLDSENNAVVTFMSGMAGLEKGSVLELEKNTEYEVTEISAPDRYDGSVNITGKYRFKTDADGNVTYTANGSSGKGMMPFVNSYEYQPGAIEFTKQYVGKDFSGMDEAQINEWLSETTFSLYEGTSLLAQTSPKWDGKKAVVTFKSGETYGSMSLLLELDGEYRIVETCPLGYENASDVSLKVTFTEKGEPIYYTVYGNDAENAEKAEGEVVLKNTEIVVSSDIMLYKYFSNTKLSELTETQLSELVKSTQFTLYSDEKCSKPVISGSAKPDIEGNRLVFTFTSDDIVPGGVYYILEQGAPAYTEDGNTVSYKPSTDKIKAEVAADGKSVEYSVNGGDPVISVRSVLNTLVPAPKKADLTLIKEYYDGSSVKIDYSELDKEVFDDTVFGLIKEGEATPFVTANPDPKDGTVTFKELVDGNYTLIETKAHETFLQSKDVYSVNVDNGEITLTAQNSPSDGAYINNDGVLVYTNDMLPLKIEITKSYQDTPLDQLTSEEREALRVGTEFTLYSSEKCDNADITAVTHGLIYENGKMYVRFTESDNIKPGGKYWLKETKAPDGYYINDQVIAVTIDENGVTKYDGLVTTPDIENEKIYKAGDIELKKEYVGAQSSDVEALAKGTTFTLYDSYSELEKNEIDTASPKENSSGEWIVTFSGLDLNGTYYVAETDAPDGYALSTNVYMFHIDEKGKVSYKLLNDAEDQYSEIVPICQNILKDHPQNIQLEKVYSDVTGEPSSELLEATKFTLYSDPSCDAKYAIKTKSPVISGGKAMVIFTESDGIELGGTYYVKETASHDDYTADETVYRFDISEDGQVSWKVNGSDGAAAAGVPVVKNMRIYVPGVIEFIKVYEDYEIPVSEISKEVADAFVNGTVFALYKGDTQVAEVHPVIEGDYFVIRFGDLELDTYYSVRESQAPSGYQTLDSTLYVYVDKLGNVLYNLDNTDEYKEYHDISFTNVKEETEPQQPESSQPETSKPETSKPETSKPESSKPESSDSGDSVTAGGDKDNTQDNPITGVALIGGTAALASFAAMIVSQTLRKKKDK